MRGAVEARSLTLIEKSAGQGLWQMNFSRDASALFRHIEQGHGSKRDAPGAKAPGVIRPAAAQRRDDARAGDDDAARLGTLWWNGREEHAQVRSESGSAGAKEKVAPDDEVAEFVTHVDQVSELIMNTTFLNAIPNRGSLLAIAALALGLFAGRAAAEDVTALNLIKEGNRYVGEQAKDKLVQIRSEKSIAGLHPNIWWVVYYDPTASLKAVEVKFGAGKMLDVKRPFRLLEPISGSDQPMDREKIKVDSDKAIKTAIAEPLLEKLTIKATKLKLERSKDFGPVWRVTLWAAKLNKPNTNVDIGEVTITADEGKVVKSDLHINRVD